MLTHQQRALVNFVKDYCAKHDGVAPTYEEIAAGLGLRSKSGVGRLVTAVEGRGLLRRYPYRARSLQVVDRRGRDAAILKRASMCAPEEIDAWLRGDAFLVRY